MSKAKPSEWKRTHYCGDIRSAHAGQEVTLFGWVNRQRDMGNLVFIDLRDREGMVQVVVTSENESLLDEAKKFRMENVVAVKGRVKERDEKSRNPQLPTGEVEVTARDLNVLSTSMNRSFLLLDTIYNI